MWEYFPLAHPWFVHSVAPSAIGETRLQRPIAPPRCSTRTASLLLDATLAHFHCIYPIPRLFFVHRLRPSPRARKGRGCLHEPTAPGVRETRAVLRRSPPARRPASSCKDAETGVLRRWPVHVWIKRPVGAGSPLHPGLSTAFATCTTRFHRPPPRCPPTSAALPRTALASTTRTHRCISPVAALDALPARSHALPLVQCNRAPPGPVVGRRRPLRSVRTS